MILATNSFRNRSHYMETLDRDLVKHLHWGEHLRGLRPNTLRVRESVLARLHFHIDRPLRDAQTGHLLGWEQHIVSGLQPESRRAYVAHARSFYAWAIAAGIVDSDPTTLLTQPRIPKPLPRPIGEDDLRLAIDAAPPKLAAMLTLMADAGLRCMEVAQLQWADLQVGEEAWLIVRDGKGGKDRAVPIGMNIINSLRRYGWKNRGFIFLGLNGRPMKAGSVSGLVNKHLEKLHIPYTAHKLRSRYATQLAQITDLATVAEIMGWASLRTAQHYIKPNREAAKVIVAALDELASSA